MDPVQMAKSIAEQFGVRMDSRLWLALIVLLSIAALIILVGGVGKAIKEIRSWFPSTRSNRRRKRRQMPSSLAITAVGLVFVGLASVAIGFAILVRLQSRDSAIKAAPMIHASRLRPILIEDLGIGDGIEYDMRGDQSPDKRLRVYAKRIEDWRTLVGTFLHDKLPNSGADTKFLTFRPTVGQGPIKYEYDRLNEMRSNLVYVSENLESYSSRSSTLPDGTEALVELRARGVELRNRQLANEVAWMPWHHEWEEWQKSVKREMRSIGVPPGDIGKFETLNEVPARVFNWSVGPTHTKDLRELSEQLDRLQSIIERHDARPRPGV